MSRMEQFADFLPFSEDIQEAFDNYNIEAASLTITALPHGMGSVIGRVVWRSPLLKVGNDKKHEAIHFTLMDAEGIEITGTAWGKVAQKFNEVLKKDKIYKFPNAVPLSKEAYNAVKNDRFESRVISQKIELRFSGVVEPELVSQTPYPDIDQSQFRCDYETIQVGQVTSVVGIVTAQFMYKNQFYICLSNGSGRCIGISFEQDKLEELKEMQITPRYTVLGVLGVGKLTDINTETTGDKVPKALFKTFNDSVLMNEPLCEAAKQLVIWRDLLPKQYGQMQ